MIIHDVEQGTDEWHKLRGPIPTASEFSRIITSTGKPSDGLEEYANLLAAGKFTGKVPAGFAGSKSTRRGNELEPEADADYEMTYQVEVEHVGFVTNNLMQYGCSPDGLVNKDGAVEYKCMEDKAHVKYLREYHATGKTPTIYVAQTQGVLFVTGRKWCDLHLYHPDLPSVTIRQYPDKDFFKALRKQLKAVEIERNLVVDLLNEIRSN